MNPILKSIDNFLGRFFGRVKEERAVPMVVNPGAHNNFFGFNLNTLSPEAQRVAYRSIVEMLVSFRARNMCKGMLNMEVKRRLPNEKLGDLAAGNPFTKILRRPNEHTPSSVQYNWMFQAIDVQGHADFMVEYGSTLGASVPIALHPIYPQFARVEPNFGGMGNIVSWYFQVYGGGPVNLPYEMIVRIKRPHPVSPWDTAGKIEAGVYEIHRLQLENVFGRDLAGDQGKPRVMLETDKPINRDKAYEIASDFAAMYRTGGPTSVPVSHSGLKIKPMTITPEQLDFIASQQFTREQLFTIFEVPIQIFSGEAYATGSNSARVGFMENTVQPAVDDVAPQWEFELERIFGVRQKGTLALVPPNMVPVNRKELAEINGRRIANGVPINRILAELGEDPVQGGDVSLVPATLVPLELVGEGMQ